MPLSEYDFQRQVIDLASIFGWQYVHFRPAQTTRGWRTAVQGPLGKGWPDLILTRRTRLLAVELKADGKKATADQLMVLSALQHVGAETAVWHPSDFDQIQEALR